MKLFNAIKSLWSKLPTYKTYKEMPGWLLTITGLGSIFVASYYGWVLKEALPMYYEAGSKANELGALGVFLGVLLACIFVLTYVFGQQALACHKAIQERYFK